MVVLNPWGSLWEGDRWTKYGIDWNIRGRYRRSGNNLRLVVVAVRFSFGVDVATRDSRLASDVRSTSNSTVGDLGKSYVTRPG